MQLASKITAVTRVLRQAEKHAQTFASKANIKCPAQCYMCCTKTNIEATVLEFLPAARAIYLSNQHDSMLGRIEQSTDGRCAFLNPFFEHGGCSMYQHRGLICRLFGYNTHADKQGNLQWSSCKILKTPENATRAIQTGSSAPNMQSYYLKLYGIDLISATRYYPINKAIELALEQVIMDDKYRKKPA